MKRWVGLLVAATLAIGGCTDAGDRADEDRPRAGGTEQPAPSTSVVAPQPTSVPTSTTALPPEVQKVQDLLVVLAPLVPIPEDARECVAARLAGHPEAVAELGATTARSGPPDAVMDAGAACMDELHALPVFLEGVDERVEGGLDGSQRSCVERGYLSLDQEVLDALMAEALGARRDAGATGRVESMLHACGVEVGG